MPSKSSHAVVVVPDFLTPASTYRAFVSRQGLNQDRFFYFLDIRNTHKKSHHFEMHHMLDGDDFKLFLDSIPHQKVSVIGFGTGVKTGAAMASRCADRVGGFVGVGGSTMNYQEIDTWRDRRDKMRQLATVAPCDRVAQIGRIFGDDREFADRLAMWKEGKELSLNLDVIANAMGRRSQPYLGHSPTGVFVGPSMFVLPDNCRNLPIGTCTLPIRDVFPGLQQNLNKELFVLQSEHERLHESAPTELARLILKFWRWRDGVRAEYVHRGEVDQARRVWPIGQEPKMPFYPQDNAPDGSQFTGFHKN